MTLSFFTNYLNHHQHPVARELWTQLGDGYTFVATHPVSQARLKMGYRDEDKAYPFVLTTYDSPESACKAKQLADESDVVIIGSAPDDYIVRRLKRGKLTLRYSERYFKKGWSLRTAVRYMLSMLKHVRRFQNYPLYYLCASAYTAADANKFADFHDRTYKWGYFTEIKRYDTQQFFAHKEQNKCIVILWCGRMIDWKHPEAAVEIADRLKKQGYNFELRFVGDGPMMNSLRAMVQERALSDHVFFMGSMPPEKVRAHMEAANIFLFTSDFNEGWGAVLNESMNSGCAVVASHAIGSAPFLIENDQNGFIYRNGDMDDLYEKTRMLMDSAELRRELGENAYHTMADLWNAEVAAERLLQLIDELQRHGQCDLFDKGPCSRAEILKNGWL